MPTTAAKPCCRLCGRTGGLAPLRRCLLCPGCKRAEVAKMLAGRRAAALARRGGPKLAEEIDPGQLYRVYRSDLAALVDVLVATRATRAGADDLVRRLNASEYARGGRGAPLYYLERRDNLFDGDAGDDD